MARTAKNQISAELERVLELLTEEGKEIGRRLLGLRYEEKHQQKLPPRRLQRRIEELVARGSVLVVGDGPSTAYKPGGHEGNFLDREEGYVPLSTPGMKARNSIRRPMSARTPVGYDSDWLHTYHPGDTWYLPKAVRVHLKEKGRTSSGHRPAGTFARDVLSRLLIDLSWASSRLEGNTYTRLETKNLLEFGQRAEGKDVREAQMILNHKAAIELLVSGQEYLGYNRTTIQALHAALSENLLADSADEGRLRERPVEITGTVYTPTAIPQLIQGSLDTILKCAVAIPDALEASFFLMVHLPYLQPFVDVNKGTSRLAANMPLIAANLCPLSFVDVPETAYIEGNLAVYEQRQIALLRDVFVYAYERSCTQYRVVRDSLPSPDPVRLRYREELQAIVRATIQAGEAPNESRMKVRAAEMRIPEEEAGRFAELAMETLVNINEGTAARYQVTPQQLRAWMIAVIGKG